MPEHQYAVAQALVDLYQAFYRESLPPAERQYVTLDQAAALVRRSKRTLEKYWYDQAKRRRHNPPEPALEGGGGRAHEWDWDDIRPWLERVFRRKLPDVLPDTFRRS
jgi:hypothetical protein